MHKAVAAMAAETILYFEGGAYSPLDVAELAQHIRQHENPAAYVRRMIVTEESR